MKESWNAIALHPSFPEGKLGCQIKLEEGKLLGSFAQGESFSLDLEDLSVSLEGETSNLLYLRSLSQEDFPTLTVRDRSILQTLKSSGVNNLHDSSISTKKPWSWKTWSTWGLTFFSIFLCGLIACYYLYGTDFAIRNIEWQTDIKIGNEILANPPVKSLPFWKHKKSETSLIRENLALILQRLREGEVQSYYDFSLEIISKKEALVTTLPNGKIFITDGLLQKLKSSQELSALLAHEMSHVLRRHILKILMQKADHSVTIQAILGDATALQEHLLEKSKESKGLKYSRDMEYEADYYAFLMLYNAGIHPQSLINFFQRWNKEYPEQVYEHFAVYPISSARIQNLEKFISTTSHFQAKPLDVNWDEVLNALNAKE